MRPETFLADLLASPRRATLMRSSVSVFQVIIGLDLDPRDDLPEIIGVRNDRTIRRHGRDDMLEPAARKTLLLQIDRAQRDETEQSIVGIAVDPYAARKGRAHAAASAAAMTARAAKAAVKPMALGRERGIVRGLPGSIGIDEAPYFGRLRHHKRGL